MWRSKSLSVFTPKEAVISPEHDVIFGEISVARWYSKDGKFTQAQMEKKLEKRIKDAVADKSSLAYVKELKSSRRKLSHVLEKLESARLVKIDRDGKYTIENSFYKFLRLIKMAKRSLERKVRWAVFYLLKSGKNSFTTNELLEILPEKKEKVENMLSKFALKDKNQEWVIRNGDPESLIVDLEAPLKEPRGLIGTMCLEYLHTMSYSGDELAELLKAHPSTVSRSLKRLREKESILPAKGPRGRDYYIVNCSACPFGLNEGECKEELVKEIKKTAQEQLGISLTQIPWQYFPNIPLRKFLLTLKTMKVQTPYKKDIRKFRELCEIIFIKYASLLEKKLDKEGPPGEPYLYFLGMKHARMKEKQK